MVPILLKEVCPILRIFNLFEWKVVSGKYKNTSEVSSLDSIRSRISVLGCHVCVVGSIDCEGVEFLPELGNLHFETVT